MVENTRAFVKTKKISLNKKRVSSRDEKETKNEKVFEDYSTSVTPMKISVPKDSLKIEMKP